MTRTIDICYWDISNIFIKWYSFLLICYIKCKTIQNRASCKWSFKTRPLTHFEPDSHLLGKSPVLPTNIHNTSHIYVLDSWVCIVNFPREMGILCQIFLKSFHCCYWWDKETVNIQDIFLIMKISLKDKGPFTQQQS